MLKKDDGFPVFGLDSLMNGMMNQALQSFRKLNDFIPSSRHTEIFDILDENGEQIIILEVNMSFNFTVKVIE